MHREVTPDKSSSGLCASGFSSFLHLKLMAAPSSTSMIMPDSSNKISR